MLTPWLEALVDSAHQALLHDAAAEPARAFLRSRGVAEADWVSHRLGYGSMDRPVQQCTEKFRAWAPKGWFESLVFPLALPPLGRVYGLQTRALAPGEGMARYQQFLALPSDIFPSVFGLHQALPAVWETKTVVLVEGVFDYFAVRTAGHDGVLALLTARASKTVLRWCERYAARVVLLLDTDPAGRVGAFHAAGLPAPEVYRREGYRVPRYRPSPYELRVPTYFRKDPGEFLEQGDVGTLRELLVKNCVPVHPMTLPSPV